MIPCGDKPNSRKYLDSITLKHKWLITNEAAIKHIA